MIKNQLDMIYMTDSSTSLFMDLNINKQSQLIQTIITSKYYKQIVVEDLLIKQSYKNVMEIPKLTKIVINTSSKIIIKDKKYLIPSLIALEIITGQKIKSRTAKKSIATFKLREKQIIGCKVTLRGSKMVGFLEKLMYVILPRLRDFRGLNRSPIERSSTEFDQGVPYNLGIKNFLLFHELENFFEFFEFLAGVDISINTSTKNKKEGQIFLSCFQIPTVFNK